MRELDIEQRLIRIEENIAVICNLLENTVQRDAAKPVSENEIMSVKQLAQFLGIDPAIIYSKCGKNAIPYFKLGKQYRFKRNEIEKWLKENKTDHKITVDDFVDRYLQKNIMKS